MPRAYWDYDSVNISRPLPTPFPREAHDSIPSFRVAALLSSKWSLTSLISQAGVSWRTTRLFAKSVGHASRDIRRRGGQLTGLQMCRPWKVQRSFRGHQRRQLPKVCHQGSQTSQEEEDQARDQDPSEPGRRAKRRRAVGCGQGLTGDYNFLWQYQLRPPPRL